MRPDSVRGFTLVELLVTLAVIATLSFLIVPVVQITVQRSKEVELKAALKEIRAAIDAYKQSSESGEIVEPSGDITGYPPSLGVLAEGVRYRDEKIKGKKYFLRKLPRDPMNPNTDLPAADTWGTRCYESEAQEPRPGPDVYDVYSLSTKTGLNGVPYKLW